MNINMKGNGALLFGAGSLLKAGGLKSATERQERKEKSEREIAFFEKQKENLKNKECATLEEIERKLEMLNTYEDEIAAVKAAYNKEEMFHILDEAREQGEKNAEAAKKNEPKTPEERKKEMAEEALGLDEEKGVLSETMEELTQAVEEAVEETVEEATEVMETIEEAAEKAAEKAAGEAAQRAVEENVEETVEMKALEQQARRYERFDARI